VRNAEEAHVLAHFSGDVFLFLTKADHSRCSVLVQVWEVKVPDKVFHIFYFTSSNLGPKFPGNLGKQKVRTRRRLRS